MLLDLLVDVCADAGYRYNLPDLMIEMISQIPMKNAMTKLIIPRSDRPKIVGPTPVECIMAELTRIALMIKPKVIRLLERSMSVMSLSSPPCDTLT